MNENAIRTLLVIIVLTAVGAATMAMPESYRKCVTSFKPVSYCAAKELAK